MKKKLLALLTAAFIFSACQKEDTVTENAAGEITSAEKSVSDTAETSAVVSSEKVTETTASESVAKLTEESAETEELPDETLLQTALRKAGDMDNYTVGRIFIDLNFDSFPEMIKCGGYESYYLYTFNTEACKWELFAVTGSKLYLYNDEERGERFYFFVEYSDYNGAPIIERLNFYSDNTFVGEVIGDADIFAENYLGIPDAYVDKDLGKIVAYQHTNGAFAVGEFDGYSEEITEFYYSVAEKGLEEYTLERIIDLNEMTAGVDRSQKFEIFAEEFSDEPQESGLPKRVKDENKNWIPSCRTFLDADKMNGEAFAKLAENEKLTYLIIYANDEDVLDFNGIGRLENLKELVVSGSGKSFINTAEIGKLKNLEVLDITAELDDYDFLSELDSLKIIQFGNTSDKPADFFKPIYGMKNLRYLLVFVWDYNITTEQVEELEKNMPQLCICYYKRG